MKSHIESLRNKRSGRPDPQAWRESAAIHAEDKHDEDIFSIDLIKRGPLVVNFMRGSWCPFCSAEVRARNEVYDQFRQAGVEVVVLSPQSLYRTRKQAMAGKLKFNLLADKNNETAKPLDWSIRSLRT